MRIGVLGAGRMAAALVPGWVSAGHDVLVAGRTPSRAAAVAEQAGARSGSLADAATFGDVTLLAVLYAGVDATLHAAGADDGTLRGRVLVDITNQVDTETFLLRNPELSIAEQIAQRTGADVVKALHQVHGAVFAERARYGDHPLVVPMAGSQHAKSVAAGLIRDLAAEPLDAGDLRQARNLEAMAAVVVRQLFGGADPLSAFQFMTGAAAR